MEILGALACAAAGPESTRSIVVIAFVGTHINQTLFFGCVIRGMGPDSVKHQLQLRSDLNHAFLTQTPIFGNLPWYSAFPKLIRCWQSIILALPQEYNYNQIRHRGK
jgi:hypothetical protein